MLRLEYRKTLGTQAAKPLAVDEASSPKSVYLRRNIERVVITPEQGEPYRAWQYEEAVLTKEEYEGEYKDMIAEKDTPAMQELKEANESLNEGLGDVYVQLENQQECIDGLNDAIADIYELLLESGLIED